jgi:hypothetical protein
MGGELPPPTYARHLLVPIPIEGRQYEIARLAGPVWSLIEQDGESMSQESFDALPERVRSELYSEVMKYIDRILGDLNLRAAIDGMETPVGAGLGTQVPRGRGPHYSDELAEAAKRASLMYDGFHTDLPPEYEGPTALRYSSRFKGVQWAIFPSVEDARTAADGAVRVDIGGYHDVLVTTASSAPLDTPSFSSALHWLFPEEFEQDRHERSTADLDALTEGLLAFRNVVAVSHAAGIGHNGPPDDGPPLELEEVDAAIKVVAGYRHLLTDPSAYDTILIEGFESYLGAFGKRMGKFLEWLLRFPEEMWNAVVKKSPEWVAKELFMGASIVIAAKLLHLF